MHLTGSETQLLSEPLLMRQEIVLGLFRLSSLMEHKLNLVLSIKQLNAQHFSNLDAHSMKAKTPDYVRNQPVYIADVATYRMYWQHQH